MRRLLAVLSISVVSIACVLPRGDRPNEAKAAAAQGPAVKSETSGDVQLRADYLSKVIVSKLTAHKFTNSLRESIAMVDADVKNTGNRSLDEVQITLYFLDRGGKIVHEHIAHPVLAGGFSEDPPLRANYATKFGGGFRDVSDEWSGNVSVKVTDVKFSAQ